MDPMVLAAGTALVSAMATDSWQQVRDATVRWWRGADATDADAVGAQLDEVRPQVLTARQAGDEDSERVLAEAWRVRLQQALRDRPDLAAELRGLLDEQVIPALPDSERPQLGSPVMKATASGNGRVYQAGRDQHITER
ncbi:hypothetical protein [Streptomyces sp. NPDC060366]|uniref:hypothetical protein n=1 Tax=Streptomyces sp. NPDC060366 TaxID=3347105 RepID=UPI0036535CE5